MTPELSMNSEIGHLMDYALKLHIITGPNGMCMCGVDGITCSERLRRVSHEIGDAILGANLVESVGGRGMKSVNTPNHTMTTEQQTKLDRIKAACRKALELADKAYPAPWTQGHAYPSDVETPNGRSAEACPHFTTQGSANAAFIAHARTFEPAAARALLLQIKWLEDDLKGYTEADNYDGISAINERIELLCSAFPKEALQ